MRRLRSSSRATRRRACGIWAASVELPLPIAAFSRAGGVRSARRGRWRNPTQRAPPGLLLRQLPRPAPVALLSRALQRAAAHGGRTVRGGRGGCVAAAAVAVFAAPQRCAAPLQQRARHLMASPIAAALPFVKQKLRADAGAPASKRPKTAAASLPPLAAGADAAEPLVDLGELVPATMLARPRCALHALPSFSPAQLRLMPPRAA